jgi:hypothetical protein
MKLILLVLSAFGFVLNMAAQSAVSGSASMTNPEGYKSTPRPLKCDG